MRALVRFSPYTLVFGIGFFYLLTSRIHMGDTVLVARGVETIRRSLVEGTLPADPMQVGHFPLYQYLPGLVFSFLGATERTSLDLFCVLNCLAFVGCVVLTVRTLRLRSPAVAAAGALVLATGPLLWYARASFGEMLAALLVLAFTAACLRGARPAVTALLLVLAGLTKETALPFLLLIAAVGLLVDRRAGRPWPRGRLAAVGMGAILTVALTAGFNCYRFGVPYNAENLQEHFLVPDLKTQVSFFAAIWVSPNGGIVFFWPSFVAALAGLAAVVLRGPWKRRPSLVPLGGVGAMLVLLTLGFSKWYSPFGWPAWGPRLMVPWVPAAMLTLFWYYAEEMEGLLTRLCSRPARGVLFVVVLAVLSLPQAAVLAGPAVYDSLWVVPPGGNPANWIPYYYRWIRHAAWPRPDRIALLSCYPALREWPVFLTSLVFTFAVAGFGLQIRARLRLAAQAAPVLLVPTGEDERPSRRSA
jgi:hypothetical protein